MSPKDAGKEGEEQKQPKKKELEESKPFVPIRDPQLAERLAWVAARLASIRNVSTYVDESQAIDGFSKIVEEVSPQDRATFVGLIQSATHAIRTFSRTDPEDRDTRRVLYD